MGSGGRLSGSHREASGPAALTPAQRADEAAVELSRLLDEVDAALAAVRTAHAANDPERWTAARAQLSARLRGASHAADRAKEHAHEGDRDAAARASTAAQRLAVIEREAAAAAEAPSGIDPVARETEIQSVLAAPIQGSIAAAYAQKETELRALLGQLDAQDSRVLAARLRRARGNDPLATAFGRMTSERRARLLQLLDDARRREWVRREDELRKPWTRRPSPQDGPLAAAPSSAAPSSAAPSATPRSGAPDLAIGKTSTAGAAHVAPPKRVADGDGSKPARRLAPNAVIKVVAYAGGKPIGEPWGAKARWEGPLPQKYTGTRSTSGWSWDNPDAKTVRIGSDLQGKGGQTVETWAGANADRIVIYAAALDAVTDAKDSAADEHAPGHATDGRAGGDGSASSSEHTGSWHRHDARVDAAPGHSAVGAPEGTGELGQALHADVGGSADGDLGPSEADEKLADDFERQLDIGPAEDDDDGTETHGRAGEDTRRGGTGPGGERARPDGDGKGSEDGGRGGTQDGSRDGEKGGAPDGMYGGEGKLGDDGVPSGSGIIGIVGVPAALRGAVEVALIAADGNITGAGSGLFRKGLGKLTTVVKVREMIASQARVTAAKETKAALKQIATNPTSAAAWKAASKEAKAAVTRRLYWEMQRRYFDAYLAAAKQVRRDATAALKRSGKDVAARQRLATAEMAEEAATVKPVAGRLPQNHEYAGQAFPVDRLPAKYRAKGVRFTPDGYPDFAPHARQLPNGKNYVEIEYTGSRVADEALAAKRAGLQRAPDKHTWHHAEDGKKMFLVPTDLHDAVRHTGGTSAFRHQRGVGKYGQ